MMGHIPPDQRVFVPILLLAALLPVGCHSESGFKDETESRFPMGETPGPPSATGAEALRDAALRGQGDAVRLSIRGGADVNSRDEEGRTALMLASFNGHTDTVRLLLEQGAHIDERDNSGRTALMYASTGPFAETVEVLLWNHADANAADQGERWTPLMFAAGEGQVEVIRTLLRYGADATATDTDGDSAAEHAKRRGHTEAVRVLTAAPR